MSLITCENVRLSYENKVVLSDVSFSVNKGDYLCIVGENGSGKSTLIKALLGLKAVSGGSIDYGEALRPRDIGYLPQQTLSHTDFPASVFEVVLSGCLNKMGIIPFYTKKHKETALGNMRKLHIEQLKNKCFGELSGGQQQRVLLARALCAAGQVLLLDEPTAGLDQKVTGELYDIIAQLNKEGVTVIMVSHDISAAVKYASHILHLRNTPVFFGSAADYLAQGGEKGV